MSDLERQLAQADSLLESDQFEEAYACYDGISAKLLDSLRETKTARKISKGAGWLAAAVTGGFGVEDFIVVPAVNKILLNLLGIDLEALLKYLFHSESQKLQILVIFSPTFSKLTSKQVLLNFLLTYRLTASLSDRTMLDKLFNLVNPLVDSSPVSGLECDLAVTDLQAQILEHAKTEGEIVQYLNGFLFLYLSTIGLISSPLFEYLRPHYEAHSSRSTNDADRSAYFGSVLGLKGNVTKEEIRKRYRDLIKQYHPDKHSRASEKEQADFEKKTKTVNEAFAWFKKEHGV